MIYKVLNAEATSTSTGKAMKKLSLEGENGVQNVNIFSDFPRYAEITVGSSIDGEIRKNQKGYDNLYSNEVKRGYAPRSPSQTANIEKAMDRKEASIGKFQDDKDFNIMVSSTMRDAVQLAIAEFGNERVLDTLEQGITKWRNWLIANWNVDKKDIPPF